MAVTSAHPAEKYLVEGADPRPLTERAPPDIPSLAPYTAEAVAERIGSRAGGFVQTKRMVVLDALEEFTGGDGRLAIWAARQKRNPHAIVVSGGYVTPRDIARSVDASIFEEVRSGVYVARVPILVKRGGTLHVDSATRALRLSEEAGSFLINDGRLFVTDSAIVAWRESAGAPASFRRDSAFRPFILSWGGTETYFANSRFVSLGYADTKSYGLAISQYPPDQDSRTRRDPPTGWIIDSSFHDMWFGFYCHEAEDVVLKGNEYRESIVYGIDPHDRSHGLIIAENEVTGTRRKHGIIISREVNDSWLIGNISTGNALSGMVLDRQSSGNVVANNLLDGNGSDGLTIYESPDNLLWGNKSVGNASHGFRVRNSTGIELYDNIAISNAFSGISGIAKRLPSGSRNLQLDPYTAEVSMTIVGGRLVYNEGGPLAVEQAESIRMAGVEMRAPTREAGFVIGGVLGEHMHKVLDLLVRQQRAVVIRRDERKRREG